ncbi:MAG TPA: methionine--tRNA ligase [Kiritimatiellia bacterium]|jgi:methionyl-tRNA synthetase|nr:methionine--tRNA ligase [Kiritimatiellia bacterium]HOR97535.1 methionine--tRNA ligase [Kiritimatiellia bacterium]HPK37986.1 methionine--tRNA ligase [Kiritimatiellia bacterium]HPW75704.1 methionine--tRNA ligase [Kiritimatiellia bacterium]
MGNTKRKMVVTSALPYANGDIHIGHLVEYLQTDFWVRFQKMRGHACVYVCADDTHGTPIMVRARAEGISPEELIARSYERHTRDFADFEIQFDQYHSTHSEENRALCNTIFESMRQSGAVTVRKLPQLYCEQDAMFLPDRFVQGVCPKCGAAGQYGDACDVCSQTYPAEELKEAHCTLCGNVPVTRDSEHLFFELEPFRDFLKAWIPDHTAPDVANKLLEWFNEPLRGWCISRDAPYFGFEIPGYPGKFFYVWVDAPIGYMASLQKWCALHGESFDAWWQQPGGELYHFIGKDIVRFHCLFWPAMLHTADYKTPDQVFVHGFLTVNGEKMSKSKGTFIKARTWLEHLKPQDLRFYYACKLNGTTDDMDLNLGDFISRVNSDLVGKITNLASRGAQMLHKSLGGRMGSMDVEGRALYEKAVGKAERIAAHYENRDFSKVMVEVRDLADQANQYFDGQAPWALVKTDPEAARAVMTSILNLFRVLTIYLQPVLPGYAARVAALFNEQPYVWPDIARPVENLPIGPYVYLATRVEQASVERLIEASREPERSAVPAQSAKPAAQPAEPVRETIDYDTFSQMDLRVAEVLSAEPVEGADKLLKLQLDIGEERPRQVFAGIRRHCDAASLVGCRVVMVANLAPRKMRFGVSEGMILAAGNPDGTLFVIQADPGALPGATVK